MPQPFQTPQEAIEAARRLIPEGKVSTIEEILVSATKQFPESDDILSHLGYFYFKTCQYTQAIDVLNQLAERRGEDAAICKMLADSHAAIGDNANARKWLRKSSSGGMVALRSLSMGLNTILQRGIRFLGRNRVLRLASRYMRAVFNAWLFATIWSADLLFARWLLPEYRGSDFRFHKLIAFLWRYDPEFLSHVLALHKNRELILTSCRLPKEPNALILDIGTGANPLPLYWAALGHRVTALDGSLYGVPHLRQTEDLIRQDNAALEIKYAAGDMLQLPFRDGSFDYITSICAIEHVPGDGDMLCAKEMRRVLKPGGRAVITLESNGRFLETWMEVPYERGYQSGMDAAHTAAAWQKVFCRNYTLDAMMERIASQADWRVVETGFYDNKLIPARVWLDPIRRPILSKLLHPLSPLLSVCFYLPTEFHQEMSSSSIGYLILEKE